jgi:uncharacterized damage-inducible protein DinB
MPLGYLASLVATMPAWITLIIDREEMSLEDTTTGFTPTVVATTGELLHRLDESTAKARESFHATTEEHLLKPWRLKIGGRVVSEAPRHIMITDSVFSHLAHHRGQLTVYLRLNEAKVPAIYGPSADEKV